MVAVPRIVADPEAYFRSLARPEQDRDELRLSPGVPEIGPVLGGLLELLCRIMHVRLVLELGAAQGYSTMFLARAARDCGGAVLSLDLHQRHCREAACRLGRARLDAGCLVACADARMLPARNGCFDLVFLDVDQRYYSALEPVCYDALRPGGLLVVDNTAFEDACGLNAALRDNGRWDAVNLLAFLPDHAPEHDGFCLARKR